MIIFNAQAEQVDLLDDELWCIAILHDDRPNPLQIWQGKNVWAYRAMSPYSQIYHQLPQKARFIFDNEKDNERDVSKWVNYLQEIKTNRPDIVLIYPATNTEGWPESGNWPVDPTIKSMCYFYALHIPDFATVQQLWHLLLGWMNPWCVTEVESPPGTVNLASRMMQGADTALKAGAQVAALWGQDMSIADALNDSTLRALVKEYNKNSTITAPEVPKDVADIGLSIGPGVNQWIKDHQATPLSNENYLSPNFTQSVTAVQIGNAQGQPEEGIVLYDKTTGQITYFVKA